MNFHIVRTIRSFPSSFFSASLSSFFFFSLFFFLFVVHFYVSRERCSTKKTSQRTMNLLLIPHFDHDTVTRRKIYETCSQRAAYWWKISLRFFFFLPRIFPFFFLLFLSPFFFSFSLFFSLSRLGQDKLSSGKGIFQKFLSKGKFIDWNVPCSGQIENCRCWWYEEI